MKDKHKELLDSFLASGIFCLPTLFFFPPAEIWHWIVFFLIFCDTSKRGCPSFCHTVSRRECFNSSVLWAEEPDGKFCLASAAEGQAHLLTWLGNFWCDAPIYLSRISIAFTSISLRDFRSSIGTLRILHFLQCFRYCLSHNAVGLQLLPQNCHLVLRWQKLSGSGGWSPENVEKWKRNGTITKER